MAEQLFEEYSDEMLEIYIAYDRLKAKDLARFLKNFSHVADVLAADYFARIDRQETGEMPSLDIESMQTGESIKFTLKEGWLPKINSSTEADIVVELPKALGLPFVIGYLALQLLNSYQDSRIKQLDINLKELDIRLKQTQLSTAITNNASQPLSQTVNFYMDNRVPEVKPILLDTLKTVLRNPEIRQFKIHGIDIK